MSNVIQLFEATIPCGNYRGHTITKKGKDYWIDGPTIDDDLPPQWGGASLNEAKANIDYFTGERL